MQIALETPTQQHICSVIYFSMTWWQCVHLFLCASCISLDCHGRPRKAKGGNSCRLSPAVTTPSLVTHSTDLSAVCVRGCPAVPRTCQRRGPSWFSVVSLVCSGLNLVNRGENEAPSVPVADLRLRLGKKSSLGRPG